MNVYSVRLIPKLKLKLCEFLGIASDGAIQELAERLIRIDQKMDRFDSQLRRLHRGQMVLEANQAKGMLPEKKKRSSAKPAKKNSVKSAAAQRITAKKAKSAAKKPNKVPANVTPIPILPPEIAPVPLKIPEKQSAVLLIQSDPATRKTVAKYFGKGTQVLAVDEVSEIPDEIEDKKLLAIFFERNLLGNPMAGAILSELKSSLPDTQFVGISSYLTLALAKAADEQSDFANFLTQPVREEDLSQVFEGGDLNENQAIAYTD